LYLKIKKLINRKNEFKKETHASAAFSLTVSTRLFASCSALFLFASFDKSDFVSSNLSFTASTADENKIEEMIMKN